MDQKKLLGVVAIGGGLLWYMSSQSASTLPDATTTASTTTVTPTTTTTTTTGDGSSDDGSTTDDSTSTDDSSTTDGSSTTETTEGSDDSNVADDPCSKYRKSHHESKKVWMNSEKKKEWGGSYIPKGIKMDDFETNQEQYFINQEVEWELDLSVYNTSKANCGESWTGVDKKCWLAPYADGGAAGNDCCLTWTIVWTDPQGNTHTDDSGVITRHNVWSNLNGKFRIPNVESSIGVWQVAIEYKYKDKGSVSWDGDVFWVVPENCGDNASAAETFKSDFSRPIFAPRITQQSFMQF